MNILKHMEAVFVAAAVFAIGGSYALDRLPEAHAKVAVAASVQAPAPVVVIKAKRMSAEEKRQSLQAERNASDRIAGVHDAASRS
jgi:hypothetical protein